jgi:ribosomal protein S18 acetylase RimI-like enzyme
VAAVPDSNTSTGPDKVIGGIRCRLERQDPAGDQGEQETTLYIQTLHLLSPYRGYGVAAALLNSLLFEVSPGLKGQHRLSQLVKHYNIRRVTAHVHEANEDGLRWYTARGFEVQEGVVEGYYRRLNPSGARIVKLDLKWQDENEQVDVANKNDEEALQSTSRSDPDDEDWEKVEAKDGDEGDHGVQPLPDSQSFDENTPSKKRKAEDEKGNAPQRR